MEMGLLLIAVIGGAVIVLVGGLVLVLTTGRKKKFDPDAGLDEDLSQYPPAPKAGTHRLKFEGQPVRMRLVVLASGKIVELNSDMAEGLLQSIVHGLGEVADLDKPRIKVWPPQLSMVGFAPTFFRHIGRPEPSGQPSKWILVAGPAKVGGRAMLVGMALTANEPSTRGNVNMRQEDWADKFRIQIVE
jgi:hypothetical protein